MGLEKICERLRARSITIINYRRRNDYCKGQIHQTPIYKYQPSTTNQNFLEEIRMKSLAVKKSKRAEDDATPRPTTRTLVDAEGQIMRARTELELSAHEAEPN
ncbi:hypothetical protein NECAME_13643 [Necator americanus]|uniref:Uncharacterized protein n=1 Tax=Necator americanus TaxID=51031 RepID=W2SW33_NECAM|nr:hypothetical protein NECAME_13643 [Necator americanus]ETN73036.1 hypothetical protein NECAME_13643 [Necator americanus]